MIAEDKFQHSPTVFVVLSFSIDKSDHYTRTYSHGYFGGRVEHLADRIADYKKAEERFNLLVEEAKRYDIGKEGKILLDLPSEFAYVDGEGDECHIILFPA